MEDPRAIFKITGPNLDRDQVTVTRGGLKVGRVAGNDLVLDHPLISRQHMRFAWRDGGFWVEDLGSRNGTWIGDRRLEPNTPERLTPGDAIRTGPYLFTYEGLVGVGLVEAAPEGEAPPVHPQPLPSPLPEQPVSEPKPEARAEAPALPPLPSHLPEGSDIESPPPLPKPQPPAAAEPQPIPSPPPSLPDAPFLPPSEPPPAPPRNGAYPIGVPRDRSNWLQYLPSIYAEDAFTGRFLLIFESVMAPLSWIIDNFDFYLSPETTPVEWLRWMASWFDLLLLPSLKLEQQQAIMSQAGWLFLRRGTRAALERLLELYFGVKPEIIENTGRPCHFTVRLPLGRGEAALSRAVAERLIESQKPAFAGYSLEIT